MARFIIKDAFQLQSTGKLLFPGKYYTTIGEADEKEIREVFACCVKEVASKPKAVKEEAAPVEPPKEPEVPVDPVQDLTTVPGVGKRLLGKLSESGITTVDQLKAFMEKEEAKELLGTAYDKILKHFTL